MKHIPRIFTHEILSPDKIVSLSDEVIHHLKTVLKKSDNSTIKLFNKESGEWLCRLDTGKKFQAICKDKINEFKPLDKPIIKLAFSLINSNKIHFILEKGTELGVDEFIPLIADFSQYSTINIEKSQKIIISAIEQCGRLDIPKINEPLLLSKFLINIEKNNLYFATDIGGKSLSETRNILNFQKYNTINLIIGPEGGFSPAEIACFKKNNINLIKLGNYIMRSETACIAAISTIDNLLSLK